MSFAFPEDGMEIAMLSELGLLIKFTMISRWPHFMYTAFDQFESNLDVFITFGVKYEST